MLAFLLDYFAALFIARRIQNILLRIPLVFVAGILNPWIAAVLAVALFGRDFQAAMQGALASVFIHWLVISIAIWFFRRRITNSNKAE